MAKVHPTAIVHPEAKLHDTVEVGPYAIIGPKVRLGAGTRIGPHAVLEGDTTLGERNRVFQFASVGAIPQDLKYGGEDTRLSIGDDNQIREFATIHIGTAGGGGAMVAMDVPPYCTAQGDRAELVGLNSVGLSRHGFSEEQINRIKDAYKILFRSKLGLNEAIAKLEAEHAGHPEIEALLDLVEDDKRGLARSHCRPAGPSGGCEVATDWPYRRRRASRAS